MTIQQILEQTFGYTSFRDSQEEIIDTVIGGGDVLVIMPTGGGKSLCYQIPALALEGMAVVISPLIALMDDQVAALRQLDIRAAALHSNLDQDTASQAISDINGGKLDILYVSPERILTQDILQLLRGNGVSLFAIDEAHCVSVWGNDFRPEYVKLAALRNHFPDTPSIALTATADAATRKDIIAQLKLRDPAVFISSFERKNISVEAREGRKRVDQIVRFLELQGNGAGIIYCLSRKGTESIAGKLNQMGYRAEAYHAGLSAQVRRDVQEQFQNDSLQIVCATIAFGMGIDKPNIRWVIHYNMPKNIEGYYQEIGRAGRDGDPASALLFYSWGDYMNLQRFIDDSEASSTFKQVQAAKLERMWQYASANSCRTNLVLNYFGEYRSEGCDHCDNCLEPHEFFDGLQYAQMALSAIVRVQESAGLNLIIDILRGSNKQEVRDRNFHTLKTYGVGRKLPFNAWRDYITQMINMGIIGIDFSDKSNLKLTPLSRDIIYGKARVDLARYEPQDKKPKDTPKFSGVSENADPDLLADLKAWRLDKAKAQKVPAFVIMHDKTLVQLATLNPSHKAVLMTVDGIGKSKFEKYGEEIFALLSGQHA